MVLTSVAFNPVAPLNITAAPIGLGGNLPPAESLEGTFDYLADVYPLSDLQVRPSTLTLCFKDAHPKIVTVLKRVRKCLKIGSSSRTLVYGVLPYELDFNGMACLPGRYAVGSGVKGEGRGTIAAHEVGHNLGLKHAGCDHFEGGCEPWPYLHGGIDNADGCGLNVPTLQPVPSQGQGFPNLFICQTGGEDLCRRDGVTDHSHDFMSEGDFPKWISVLNWQRLFTRLSGLPLEASALPSASEYLVIGGSIDANGGLNLEPFYRVEPPEEFDDGTGNGAYSVELQAADGTALFVRRFEPTTYTDSEGASFAEVLPYTASTQRIVIRRDTAAGPQTLAVVAVSSHAPSVRVLSLNGGENWAAATPQTLAWAAADPDGDALYYAVQYSTDGGQSWRTLAVDLTDTQLTINPTMFAGSDQALIRVLATDGVNTGEARSAAFFNVPNKAPIAVIRAPGNNLVFDTGAVVIFQGAATDLEEGPLSGKSLSWVSTKDGALGTGERLAVRNLSVGFHRIIFTARDKTGAIGQAEVCVHVTPAGTANIR